MMDKNREAFEEFIADHLCHTLKFIQKNRSSTGSYYKDYIQDAWIYWQASRQAIEVELPKKMQEVVADTLIHGRVMANDMLRDCTKSITSLGIRVKGNEE